MLANKPRQPGLFSSLSQAERSFGYSAKDKLRMSTERRSDFFPESLNDVQRVFLFNRLKENIHDMIRENKMEQEFQFKLLMTAPDPNIFLNILMGWRNGKLKEKYKEHLDECIRSFYIVYPEIYHSVNQQASIDKPS